jgi:hypothetical protein
METRETNTAHFGGAIEEASSSRELSRVSEAFGTESAIQSRR